MLHVLPGLRSPRRFTGDAGDQRRARRVGMGLVCAGVCALMILGGAADAVAAPGAFGKLTPANGATGRLTAPTATWQASSGATSYTVCADTTNDNSCDATWVNVGNVTSVTWPGPELAHDTVYYWQVRAVNASGYTPADSQTWWSFRTQVDVPAAFSKSTPANGATGVSTSPTLTWGTSTRATSYEYCYDTTNDGACGGSWTSTGTDTSAALGGLSGGMTYYWHVRAIGAGGTTYADSNTWWNFTTVVEAPGAFNKTTPANGATGVSTSPTLTWGTSARATSYEYCYDTTNDSSCGGNWTSTGTNTSVGLSGLSNSTTYYWHVRAVNTGGTTYADSNTWWSFTTVVEAPGAFNKLTPANGSSHVSTSTTLTWGVSSGAASYEYCYDTTNDGACGGTWTSTGGTRVAGLSNPINETTYFWHVRAVNAGGTTYADSNTWWNFTTDVEAPGAFNKTTPANGATGVSPSPTLTWGTSTRATSYEDCYDTTNDNSCGGSWTSTGTSTSAALSSLAADTTYYWHVRALNAGGTTYADNNTWWGFSTLGTRVLGLSGDLAFGNVPVGTTATRTLTITNTGNSPLAVARITYPAGFSGALASGFHYDQPAHWDWRNLNVVTPVKNAGLCGSTYIFGPVAAVEAKVRILGGPEMDLSEQQVLSCDSTSWATPQAGGCGGGYPSKVMDYMRDVGLVNESTFPYQGPTQVSCPGSFSQTTRAKIEGYLTVPNTSYDPNAPNVDVAIDAIKNAIYQHGPVMVYFDVYNDFYSYSGGVYTHQVGQSSLGLKTLLLVGWDDANDSWIAKNDWGDTWWVLNGYVLLNRHTETSLYSHGALAILRTDSDGDGVWDGEEQPPRTIPAGGSGLLTVTFAPTASTSYGGTITVIADQTSGTNTISASGTGTGGAGRSDFSGDGKSDVLWRHGTQGDIWLWPMDGTTRVSESFVRTLPDTDWEIRGLGDQTGDGKADILWRNKVNGQVYLWPMDGSTPVDEIYVATVDPAYDIVGTGDFDGDGKSDILWRHTTLGDVWVWLMDGATPKPGGQMYIDRVDPAYVVKGVGDLDADTKADIVWHHATTGEVWVWPMNGTTRLNQVWVRTVPDTGYQIGGVADFDGDRKADILWRHATRGEVWIWTMDGPVQQAENWVGTVPETDYRIVATGDYDGDGHADILWHHATRGEVWVWLMDGATRRSEVQVGTVPEVGYQVIR